VIRLIGSLAAVALAIAVSGCGSDDSGTAIQQTPSIPSLTAPQFSTTSPVPTATVPNVTTTGKGGFDPKQPDSETNDVPPPPGSPQEAFEKQCQQNPQACG
jgi:hypothetical protein